MKAAGMLVVSLRGVNFGFWPLLGCSGQNFIVFSRKGFFYDCTRRGTSAALLMTFKSHNYGYGSCDVSVSRSVSAFDI